MILHMPRKTKPSKPEPLTPEDLKHLRQLWLQGMSMTELAEKFEQTREFIWGVLEGERPPIDPEAIRILECSFCGSTQHECVMLVAGDRAYICDGCIQICLNIIMEERPGYVQITMGNSQQVEKPPADDGQG
jgi:hypothetical protein